MMPRCGWHGRFWGSGYVKWMWVILSDTPKTWKVRNSSKMVKHSWSENLWCLPCHQEKINGPKPPKTGLRWSLVLGSYVFLVVLHQFLRNSHDRCPPHLFETMAVERCVSPWPNYEIGRNCTNFAIFCTFQVVLLHECLGNKVDCCLDNPCCHCFFQKDLALRIREPQTKLSIHAYLWVNILPGEIVQ